MRCAREIIVLGLPVRMRSGAAIGIPLTLLQWHVHSKTGVAIDIPTVANNFAVAIAIYDADRSVEPWDAHERIPSRVCALASSVYYASEPHTVWLVPIILSLHVGYTSVKPLIASWKPAFVAAFWTIAVYFVPLWRCAHDVGDVLVPASFFLSIASLSHTMDVVDVEDDRRDGVRTPAVRMGATEASAFALALGYASFLLHVLSVARSDLYDIVLITLTFCILYAPELVLVAPSAVVGAYLTANFNDALESVLRFTEPVHAFAIDSMIHGTHVVSRFDEPFRTWALDLLFGMADAGDTLGAFMVRMYEEGVRNSLH